MKRKTFYIVPELEIIPLNGGTLMQVLSTQHTSGVQDEIEHEDEDEDAPFNFAKKNNNWSWEEN